MLRWVPSWILANLCGSKFWVSRGEFRWQTLWNSLEWASFDKFTFLGDPRCRCWWRRESWWTASDFWRLPRWPKWRRIASERETRSAGLHRGCWERHFPSWKLPMLTVFPCFFSLPKIMANVYNFYWFIELARPNMPKVYKRVSEVALLSDIVINSVGIFWDVLCRWTFWGTSARTDMAMSMVWAELPATCWFLGFDSRISQISQPDSPGKCLCSGTYWSIDREDETAAVWFTQHVDMPLGRLHRCQRATASVMRKGLKGPSLAEWVAQRVQRIWGLHESSVSSSLFAFCFFPGVVWLWSLEPSQQYWLISAWLGWTAWPRPEVEEMLLAAVGSLVGGNRGDSHIRYIIYI